MNHVLSSSRRFIQVLLLLALSCGAASWAAKPDGENHGKSKKQPQAHHARVEVPVGRYFAADQRAAATDYYGQQRRAGHCPPGLAKKNNGCRPPGQAKKWSLGQPLPGAVVLYPVPQAVIARIGPAPAGYRYVRVANDLLLIAIGTQLVVDAIEDLMAL